MLFPLMFSFVLFQPGCVVGKKKHEALQASHDALQVEHSALQARYEADTAAMRAQILSLEEALAAAEAESSRLGDELAALQAEKARLVKDQSSLQASVKEMETALIELAQRKAQADARVAEYRNLLSRFKALIDAGKLKVKIVDGRMVVELATDVLFSSGSANLSKDGEAALKEVAVVLAGIPDRRFQIEGHTDNDPINTPQYPSNWELASARALVVTKALISGGMPAAQLSAASYGDLRPVASNDNKEGKAANRRIEIVVVPDLSTLPGFDALQQVD